MHKCELNLPLLIKKHTIDKDSMIKYQTAAPLKLKIENDQNALKETLPNSKIAALTYQS